MPRAAYSGVLKMVAAQAPLVHRNCVTKNIPEGIVMIKVPCQLRNAKASAQSVACTEVTGTEQPPRLLSSPDLVRLC